MDTVGNNRPPLHGTTTTSLPQSAYKMFLEQTEKVKLPFGVRVNPLWFAAIWMYAASTQQQKWKATTLGRTRGCEAAGTEMVLYLIDTAGREIPVFATVDVEELEVYT